MHCSVVHCGVADAVQYGFAGAVHCSVGYCSVLQYSGLVQVGAVQLVVYSKISTVQFSECSTVPYRWCSTGNYSGRSRVQCSSVQ